MNFPARFLVRRRKLLFLVMTLLTAACVVLIPRINVNSDLTRYLPDSSQMKQGIDRMPRTSRIRTRGCARST